MRITKRRSLLVAALSLAVGLALAGCRPDPGEPTYSQQDDFDAPFGVLEPLPGPDPYQPGEPRLSFGLFYEGRSSVQIPVDDQTVHYYIYEEAFSSRITYTQIADDDRVEGVASDRLIHAGFGWWGGGIHFDAPRDLSRWTHIVLSLKATSEAFAVVEIGMESEAGPATVSAADYGWAPDGAWHQVRVPIADLVAAGVDPAAVTAPLTLGGGPAEAGEWLKVDDVYFAQD